MNNKCKIEKCNSPKQNYILYDYGLCNYHYNYCQLCGNKYYNITEFTRLMCDICAIKNYK